jgi:tRNA A-37 threonylcarbamoyl transferase component Bud32
MCPSVSSRHNLAVVDNGAATSVLEGGREAGRGGARDTMPAADPRLGMVLADTYRVTRNIASGGMGTVYEAMHVRLQQRFSIKFLDHHLARNTEAYARFRQEAEIAASLDHDAIVQVFDFNTDVDGNPYMVMEYVDGVTLDTWMQGRRATPREVIRMFEPLCSALAAAHNAGIVHRDLKPSNVMVRGAAGESGARMGVKLLDFGISKMKSSAENMTRTNVVMGTPNYMSPEQASGNTSSVDATTDIFALGAILYELLSGRRAFDGQSTPSLLHAIVYDQPTPFGTLCPDLPPAVVSVVEKCLSKAPEDRFADAPSLLVALRAALRVTQVRRTAEVNTVEPPPAVVAPRSIGVGLVLGWVGTIAAAALGAAFVVGRTQAGAPSSEPAAVSTALPAVATKDAVAELGFRHELATPGAFVLEAGTQLYRADPRGLSYWADAEAETLMRPLPSPAHVTAIGRAREGDVLVAQADGTVTRWDRELREVPWQHRVGTAPIHAVAAAAGYLALAIGNEVHLVHAESGKPLKKFDDGRAIALVFTRYPTDALVVVRPQAVELIDADKRKSLGVAPFSGQALRAELIAEPIDGPAEIEVDFVQGDWIVRRRFRVHVGRRGQEPRLEPVSQRRL